MSDSIQARVEAVMEAFKALGDDVGAKALEIITNVGNSINHNITEQPDTIYHYTTLSGLQGMLREGTLWATPMG